MFRTLLFVVLWFTSLLIAACQSSPEAMPTLMELSADDPACFARPAHRGSYHQLKRLTIRPTSTRVPERVGVPTPTPDYSALGSYIRQLNAENDEDFRESLNLSIPAHVYTFEGESGALVSLDMRRLSGMIDPRLRLFDPESELIAMDDNSAGNLGARLMNIQLPDDGLYTIQVDGSNQEGEYQLRLRHGEQVVPPDVIITPTPTPELTFITPTPGTDPQTERLGGISPGV